MFEVYKHGKHGSTHVATRMSHDEAVTYVKRQVNIADRVPDYPLRSTWYRNETVCQVEEALDGAWTPYVQYEIRRVKHE